MTVIHTSHFPFGSYHTINLFGVLFTKKQTLSTTTINHESIHTAQMRELLYLGFYLWYFIEYAIRRISHLRSYTQSQAYHSISFEQEAYAHQHDASYLSSRQHFTWLKYI